MRARESAKGFAVAANEVKQLAGQTTKATEEIANKIKDVQGNAESASASSSMAREMLESSERLSGHAPQLRSALEKFLHLTGTS